MITYKKIDLFGNEELCFVNSRYKKPDLFNQYDDFVEKSEIKKTTDDCYTPDVIYKIVVDYVHQHYDLTNKEIIRPFFPGGDYECIDYNENSIVIDNPPFSIISKITKFYINNNIKFFLFAPHLTLFGSDIDCTHIVVGGNIIYENGASVKTSFLSNLFGDIKVLGDPDLYFKFREIEEGNKTNLPKYVYPLNVLTVSQVSYCIEKGISLKIKKGHTRHYRGLDSQKKHGKAIFGSGFLISEKAAAEKAAAEKSAAEKAAAEKENVIVWELSEKEKQIIKSLDTQ